MRRAVLVLVLVASCSDEHGPYGTLGHTCYDTGVCNPGLVCVDQTCVAAPPPAPDAATVDCDSDLAIEPNDTPVQATVTPIPSFDSCVSMVGLAMCPDADVDVYRFSVENSGIDAWIIARATSEPGSVEIELQNGDGNQVAYSTPIESQGARLIAPDLTSGTYYAFVRAGAPGVVTNYNLDIRTCGEGDCDQMVCP